MPAIASLDEPHRVERQPSELKSRHPQAYGDFAGDRHRYLEERAARKTFKPKLLAGAGLRGPGS